MRIGIDARMYGPAHGGLGRYVEQLIEHLFKIDSDNEYVLFCLENNIPELKIKNLKFKIVSLGIPWYGWAEQLKFSPVIKKEQLDLMHFPHWNAPLRYTDPFVVTIHDLIMYHYPREEASTLGPVTYWVKDKAHRLVVNHAVRGARQVLVPSEFTRQDVHTTLDVPLEKIVVTYEAPFRRNKEQGAPTAVGTSSTDSARSKFGELSEFGINKPYILYVGSAYPHKNVKGLLSAWELFVEWYGEEYQLVLVGKENYFYKRLKANHRIHSMMNGVVFAGNVSDENLEILYRGASLFVFPSLYEGFGLPPLEAMARGVPVVSSHRSCMPEILGEAALFIDPENPKQIAETMHLALIDENLRFDLKERGRGEVKRYSWEKMARQTLECYQTAVRHKM